MRGRSVSVSLPNPVGYVPKGFINAHSNGSIMLASQAGFMIEVLDEVASRAGFTWRGSCWCGLAAQQCACKARRVYARMRA